MPFVKTPAIWPPMHKWSTLTPPVYRHLPELERKARAANHRLLRIQRAGQSCAISTALFEQVAGPTFYGGRRTGALRFGETRAMALTGALCRVLNAVSGFSNRSLRALVADLLGTPYSAAQMSYDLRRLRAKGLIRRLEGRHHYVLTAAGMRVALFYTKLRNRLLGPLLAADQPPASPPLRQALKVVEAYGGSNIRSIPLRSARIASKGIRCPGDILGRTANRGNKE